MTTVVPVVAEKVTTSSVGFTVIMRYKVMFPFGSCGANHVILIDVALTATKSSGLTAAGTEKNNTECTDIKNQSKLTRFISENIHCFTLRTTSTCV